MDSNDLREREDKDDDSKLFDLLVSLLWLSLGVKHEREDEEEEEDDDDDDDEGGEEIEESFEKKGEEDEGRGEKEGERRSFGVLRERRIEGAKFMISGSPVSIFSVSSPSSSSSSSLSACC